MPGLYGSTTSYVVSATSVSTLYLGSTTTFTATTYSTNLAGLYGGSYAALPTNAEQLIQLFDNNGNVHFYLDPLTNSTTIYASFVGTASITLGNFLINGDSIIDEADNPINLQTNGQNWYFNDDGSTSFPNYTFPAGNGGSGQVLADDGSGNLYWTTIEGGVTDITAGTGIAVSTSTGSITISNIGVTSITAGTGTYVSSSTGDITIWSTGGGSTASNQVFDFGTILAPVSFTLDMGPIIV